MYQRRRTLFEHQEVACATLGFHWLSEAQRRALVRVLRDELARTSDRGRLLQFARRWLYEHRLIVLRERDLRTMIVKAIRQYEGALARSIVEAVDPLLRSRWQATLTQPHDSGATMQSWLWAAPAKHSSRQIEEVLERIEVLSGNRRHFVCNDCVPMGERVTDEPILRDLKERVHRDRLILLGGCPLTDSSQRRQHRIIGRQEETGSSCRCPVTQVIGTGLQFSADLLNTAINAQPLEKVKVAGLCSLTLAPRFRPA